MWIYYYRNALGEKVQGPDSKFQCGSIITENGLVDDNVAEYTLNSNVDLLLQMQMAA